MGDGKTVADELREWCKNGIWLNKELGPPSNKTARTIYGFVLDEWPDKIVDALAEKDAEMDSLTNSAIREAGKVTELEDKLRWRKVEDEPVPDDGKWKLCFNDVELEPWISKQGYSEYTHWRPLDLPEV